MIDIITYLAIYYQHLLLFYNPGARWRGVGEELQTGPTSGAPPRAGHNCYPGGREPSLPPMPQMQHFCLIFGTHQQNFANGGGWGGGKRLQLAVEEARAESAMALTAYGYPIATDPSFKYLGRIVLVLNDYWSAVVHNLSKARKKWAHLSRVLGSEGVDDRILVLF